MFRVYKKSPFSKINDFNNNFIPKPVLLMQHGVADSSDSFILNDVDKSPAFIAASQGYDVWLPNSRGNKYSRLHELYTDRDEKYWDYSFSEISKYDFPAFIEYIKQETQVNETIRKITVMAHS